MIDSIKEKEIINLFLGARKEIKNKFLVRLRKEIMELFLNELNNLNHLNSEQSLQQLTDDLKKINLKLISNTEVSNGSNLLKSNFFKLFLCKSIEIVSNKKNDTNEVDVHGFSPNFETSSINEENRQIEQHHPTISFNDENYLIILIKFLCEMMRFLRNTPVLCKDCQALLCDLGYIDMVYSFSRQCLIYKDCDSEILSSLFLQAARIGLQCGGNAITGHTKNQIEIWKCYFPDTFHEMIVNSDRDRKIICYVTMTIYNCLFDELSNVIQDRLYEMTKKRSFLVLLVESCIVKPQAFEEESQQDEAFQWIIILFQKMFKFHLFQELFSALSASLLSIKWSHMTPEQLVLLKIFLFCLLQDFNDPSYANYVNHETFDFFVEFLVQLKNAKDVQGDIKNERQEMWRLLEMQAKRVTIDIFGSITSQNSCLFNPESVYVNTLVVFCVSELKEISRSNSDVSSHSSLSKGYKSRLIQVMGNICFHAKRCQDIIRENDGLVLLLNHFFHEESNPFLREWSIVALRNICEGNEKNQNVIRQLKAQDVRSNIDLSKMGVEAVLQGNKIKLKPVSS